MDNRSIINGRNIIAKDRWLVSFVRSGWNLHGFLILEGLDEKEVPVRMKAELTRMIMGRGKDDEGNKFIDVDVTRGQIHYHVLSLAEIKAMYAEQSKYTCKEFTFYPEEKKRFDEKIRADQGKEILYNLGGNSKMGGFFGASLAASGSHERKEHLELAAQERARAEKCSGLSSLATLREGHNCISWAQETIKYAKPEIDPTSGFAKYVVVLPYTEIGTRCVIL